MRNPGILRLLLIFLAYGCQEVVQPLDEYYRFKGIRRIVLNKPLFTELVKGESVLLTDLLEFRDADNNPVEVPLEAISFFANETTLAGSQFDAVQQGEYKITARIGSLQSNVVALTVLPPGAYPLIRVPVVFHTVGTSMTAAQARTLIEGATAAFRNRWQNYGEPKDPLSADCYIEFYAADRDPAGNVLPVRGVDAVTALKTEYTQPEAVALAANHYWNPNRYLNVWVFNLTGSYTNSSFAYFSYVSESLIGLSTGTRGTTPSQIFGVFQNAKHTSLVPVFAHEVGHVFGLRHVFDGNGSQANACGATDPDYCGDTPYYDRLAYAANIRQLNKNRVSCDGTPYVSTNFMDYDYSYENSFTPDQRLRVRHVVSYGLWLPTPYNGYRNARQDAVPGYVRLPEGFVQPPPVVCNRSETSFSN